jgi:hypothetical protein
MRFNSSNTKQLSHDDYMWIEDNTFFNFSEIKADDVGLEQETGVFSNGIYQDRTINKRFFKEFKKWVTRFARIYGDMLWECPDGTKYDDKCRLMVNTLFTFHRYRNKLLLNTLVKCAEYVGENFLNKTDYRVLMTNLFSTIDLKDDITTRRLYEVFNKIGQYKEDDPLQAIKREYEIVGRMEDNHDDEDGREEEQEIAFKDIKTIQNNNLVVLYRGFIVCDDDDIRVGRNLPDNYVGKDGLTKKQLRFLQNSGRGASYSFCKKTAYALVMLTNSKMRNILKDKKVRIVIGQYIVPTKDIFSYTNRRSEREVIVSKNTFLFHYEFVSRGVELEPESIADFSNIKDEDYSNTLPCCYYNKNLSAIHNLKSHLKIHRIYNNTEKVQSKVNEQHDFEKERSVVNG